MKRYARAVLLLLGTILGGWGCPKDDTGSSSSSSGSPGCTSSQTCNGQVCIGGQCVACQGNAECVAEFGAASRCQSGVCTGVVSLDASVPDAANAPDSGRQDAGGGGGDAGRTDASMPDAGGGGGDAGCSAGTNGCRCTNTGSCDPGLLCRTGVGCAPPVECAALNCGAAHRLCRAATSTADAVCLDQCEQGFTWDGPTSSCIADNQDCSPAGATSILAMCTTQNRSCVEANGTASCGACLPAYVLETGTCRAKVTCNSLTCPAGCTEGGNNQDATCDPVGTCPANQAQTPGVAGTCVTCTVSCPVDAAAGLAGGHWPVTDGADKCVCKTLPGWFWDTSRYAARRCDLDGDGWINESAATFLGYSTTVPTEEAAARSFRCNTQVIDAFTLRTVFGEEHTAPLPSPVALVESDRNDDQAELDQANEPVYGGRRLLAAELNSLTRACVSSVGDANDNDVADHLESHGVMSGGSAAEQAWVDFSYFMELHTGRYVAPTGSGNGTFVIAEKPRGGGVGEAAPVYPAPGYWESCGTRPDSAFVPGMPAQGMDFARFAPVGGFGGMNHHSQFKCVLIVPTVMGNAPPNQLTAAQFTAQGLVANSCSIGAAAASLPPVEAPNPADAPVTCQASGVTLVNNAVLWAAVPYATYANAAAYTRGCVDECRETSVTCPHCPSTSSACNAGDVCQSSPAFGERTGCACPFGQYASGGVCVAHSCGDAVVYDEAYGITVATSGYEQCDLGTGTNSNTPDALCRTDCTDKRCGDGVVDTGEGCDATFGTQPNQCRAGCVAPFCGDNIVDNLAPYLEGCDNGSSRSNAPDALCRTDCRPRRCGDGIVDTGETCDNAAGNSSNPDAPCRPDCSARRCGDAVVDTGEACDIGGSNSNANGSACRTDCSGPSCAVGQYRSGTTCLTCAAGTTSAGGTVTTCTTINTCSAVTCGSGNRIFLQNSQDVAYACQTGCSAPSASTCTYSTTTVYANCALGSAPSSCTGNPLGPLTVLDCP